MAVTMIDYNDNNWDASLTRPWEGRLLLSRPPDIAKALCYFLRRYVTVPTFVTLYPDRLGRRGTRHTMPGIVWNAGRRRRVCRPRLMRIMCHV